jgi:hypothetical protein
MRGKSLDLASGALLKDQSGNDYSPDAVVEAVVMTLGATLGMEGYRRRQSDNGADITACRSAEETGRRLYAASVTISSPANDEYSSAKRVSRSASPASQMPFAANIADSTAWHAC